MGREDIKTDSKLCTIFSRSSPMDELLEPLAQEEALRRRIARRLSDKSVAKEEEQKKAGEEEAAAAGPAVEVRQCNLPVHVPAVFLPLLARAIPVRKGKWWAHALVITGPGCTLCRKAAPGLRRWHE